MTSAKRYGILFCLQEVPDLCCHRHPGATAVICAHAKLLACSLTAARQPPVHCSDTHKPAGCRGTPLYTYVAIQTHTHTPLLSCQETAGGTTNQTRSKVATGDAIVAQPTTPIQTNINPLPQHQASAYTTTATPTANTATPTFACNHTHQHAAAGMTPRVTPHSQAPKSTSDMSCGLGLRVQRFTARLKPAGHPRRHNTYRPGMLDTPQANNQICPHIRITIKPTSATQPCCQQRKASRAAAGDCSMVD
jgi:hypothetical protein